MPGHGGRAAVVVKMTFQGVSPDCAPQRRVFVQVCGERGDQPRAEGSAAGLEKGTKERNGGGVGDQAPSPGKPEKRALTCSLPLGVGLSLPEHAT